MEPPSAVHNQSESVVIYRFLLFVAGSEPNSALAYQNLMAFCQDELKGQAEVRVVDVFQDHLLALEHRVLVTPCLIMLSPLPTAMIAGTLWNKEKIRMALRLPNNK